MLANTPNPLDYAQFINGIVYSYQDLTIAISTDKRIEIKNQFSAFDYDVRQFKGSMTLSVQDSQELCQALAESGGVGISRVPFSVSISYGPLLGLNGQIYFQQDILYGCFITSGSNSHSSGSALTRKHDFVFCNLSQNGSSVV
jgi:hypothetical protein